VATIFDADRAIADAATRDRASRFMSGFAAFAESRK